MYFYNSYYICSIVTGVSRVKRKKKKKKVCVCVCVCVCVYERERERRRRKKNENRYQNCIFLDSTEKISVFRDLCNFQKVISYRFINILLAFFLRFFKASSSLAARSADIGGAPLAIAEPAGVDDEPISLVELDLSPGGRRFTWSPSKARFSPTDCSFPETPFFMLSWEAITFLEITPLGSFLTTLGENKSGGTSSGESIVVICFCFGALGATDSKIGFGGSALNPPTKYGED